MSLEIKFRHQQLPALVLVPLGLGSRFPPYSTVISNVPGPRQTMYWNGARLEGIYPTSIVSDGIAMNITLVTYDEQVHFGIMACRRSLPRVQRFIDYLEDALVELEDAVGIGSQPPTNEKAKRKAKPGATTRKSRPQAITKARSSKKTTIKARSRAKAPTKPRATAKTASPKKSG